MSVVEIILLAVGLSMDAFAVAVCKGLSMPRATLKNACIVGGWFGAFQALMPCIGFLVMDIFKEQVQSFDHWIAFILLGLIGANMIREAFGDEECADASLAPRIMLTMAIATSIDALVAGATFIGFTWWQVLVAVVSIGVITFTLSAIGVKIGNVFGARWRTGASIAGGVILILLGINILIEHLFAIQILPF